MEEFDAAGQVAGLEVCEGVGAALGRACADEDVVGAFGKELAGEFEAYAAVCYVTISMETWYGTAEFSDSPPVTSTISFARAVMRMMIHESKYFLVAVMPSERTLRLVEPAFIPFEASFEFELALGVVVEA